MVDSLSGILASAKEVPNASFDRGDTPTEKGGDDLHRFFWPGLRARPKSFAGQRGSTGHGSASGRPVRCTRLGRRRALRRSGTLRGTDSAHSGCCQRGVSVTPCWCREARAVAQSSTASRCLACGLGLPPCLLAGTLGSPSLSTCTSFALGCFLMPCPPDRS